MASFGFSQIAMPIDLSCNFCRRNLEPISCQYRELKRAESNFHRLFATLFLSYKMNINVTECIFVNPTRPTSHRETKGNAVNLCASKLI